MAGICRVLGYLTSMGECSDQELRKASGLRGDDWTYAWQALCHSGAIEFKGAVGTGRAGTKWVITESGRRALHALHNS